MDIAADYLVLISGLGVGLGLVGRMAAAADEAVLTATPVYPPFMSCARNAKADLRTTPLRMKDGLPTFDFDDMRQNVQDAQSNGRRIGWFLLCNPHNPVGRVFLKEEIEELAQFCEQYDIKVCADEVHCDLILEPGLKHVAYTTVSSGPSLTLNSPSKAYNVAGLCAAFALPSSDEILHALRVQMAGISPELNVLSLAAMEACYARGEPWLEDLLVYLRGNRDLIHDAFLAEGILESKIEGTYLAWLNAEKLYRLSPHHDKKPDLKGLATASAVLNDFKLAFNAGAAFGPDRHQYQEYVRMNFGCSRVLVEEAIKRLTTGVISQTYPM